MNNTQYVFKPKPEVADWIDENIDSWTTFCYDNVYQRQRKQYQHRFDNIGFRIFIVLMGMIIVCLSTIPISLLVNSFILVGGGLIILIGFVMLFLEVHNGRKNK